MLNKTKFANNLLHGILALSVLCTSFAVNAVTLFEQTPIDPIEGFQSDNPLTLGFLNGDNFAVGNVTVQSISWWGYSYDTGNESFVVNIFSGVNDTSGLGALAGTLTTSLLQDTNSLDYYLYTLSLTSPLDLVSGDYILSIHSLADPGDGWVWLWGTSGQSDNKSYKKDPIGSSWVIDTSTQTDMAFRLEGVNRQTVPEPTSLMLVVLGFASAAAVRNRSKFSPIV